MCAMYYHYYADVDLYYVARLSGVMWMRSDIVQEHRHWRRYGNTPPGYIVPAKNRWNAERVIFADRALNLFPNSYVVR